MRKIISFVLAFTMFVISVFCLVSCDLVNPVSVGEKGNNTSSDPIAYVEVSPDTEDEQAKISSADDTTEITSTTGTTQNSTTAVTKTTTTTAKAVQTTKKQTTTTKKKTTTTTRKGHYDDQGLWVEDEPYVDPDMPDYISYPDGCRHYDDGHWYLSPNHKNGKCPQYVEGCD